jgi:hypothetical protein
LTRLDLRSSVYGLACVLIAAMDQRSRSTGPTTLVLGIDELFMFPASFDSELDGNQLHRFFCTPLSHIHTDFTMGASARHRETEWRTSCMQSSTKTVRNAGGSCLTPTKHRERLINAATAATSSVQKHTTYMSAALKVVPE